MKVSTAAPTDVKQTDSNLEIYIAPAGGEEVIPFGAFYLRNRLYEITGGQVKGRLQTGEIDEPAVMITLGERRQRGVEGGTYVHAISVSPSGYYAHVTRDDGLELPMLPFKLTPDEARAFLKTLADETKLDGLQVGDPPGAYELLLAHGDFVVETPPDPGGPLRPTGLGADGTAHSLDGYDSSSSPD
jgi:hypothetical protein